jgi:ABC-type taurine transport system substrate-binding protein
MVQDLLTEEGGEPAKEAFQKAEDYVAKNHESKMRWLKKNATWKKEPATLKQLNYLKGLGVELEDIENITQGKASLLIDQAIRDQQSQRFNKIN